MGINLTSTQRNDNAMPPGRNCQEGWVPRRLVLVDYPMIRHLALILALVLPMAAQACPQAVPLAVSPATTAKLVRWIEAHSPYSADNLGPPEILLCQTGEVIAYEGRNVLVSRKLRAAYDTADGRIFLVAPWSADDPRDLSSLLHELVHRLQFHAHKWPCPQATEPEAYRLQKLWLTEHGISAGFDWVRIYVNARCPNDAHP